MLDSSSLHARLRALLPELSERYGVRSLAVFGSYARGEERGGSDLDLLVEFDRTPGLLGFSAVAYHIEDALGLPVDLATRAMIGPDLAPHVEADLTEV